MNEIVHAAGWQQEDRRVFIKRLPRLLSVVALTRPFGGSTGFHLSSAQSASIPWYRRTYRWGQTNINELDPQRYDLDWWRGYWKETRA